MGPTAQLLLIAVIAGVAPPVSRGNPPLTLDAQVLLLFRQQSPQIPAAKQGDTFSEPDALVDLGKALFFSKSLSGQRDVACATCHHPFLGGGDALSLSVGVGAIEADRVGPGREHDWRDKGATDPRADGGPNVPRNSLTTFNVGLFQRALFFDGRVEAIDIDGAEAEASGRFITPDSIFRRPDPHAGGNLVEAQARFPVIAQDEMRGFHFADKQRSDAVRGQIVERLRAGPPVPLGDFDGKQGVSPWLAPFRQAFNSPDASAEALITFDNIALAIGTYISSQIFIDNPWSAYLAGDKRAISEAAKRGALLFYGSYGQGGAGCVNCHSGGLFSDEQFHNLAMPQIGRGKDNGPYRDHDNGRYKVTRKQEDKYSFRTPSLLNVEMTAPYSHAGAYATLEAVVRHHLDAERAVEEFDYSLGHLPQFRDLDVAYPHARENTQMALEKLLQDREAGKDVIQDVTLTDDQIADLLEFLKALTDPCVKDRQCLAPWVPEPDSGGPDGHQLHAKVPADALE